MYVCAYVRTYSVQVGLPWLNCFGGAGRVPSLSQACQKNAYTHRQRENETVVYGRVGNDGLTSRFRAKLGLAGIVPSTLSEQSLRTRSRLISGFSRY